ncbi:MAG: radical SAM protein [Thermoproteales archaeon]|nr:radical SAM protein [Thermoproteales archaeon]
MIDWRFIRPDSIFVWNNRKVRERLYHYYNVMKDNIPAKYLIVKRFPVDFSEEMDDCELWDLHSKKHKEFEKYYKDIVNDGSFYHSLPIPKKSFLDLKIFLIKKVVEKCSLCEWRCGVNRYKGEKGVCRLDANVRVSSAFLHMGEEAPLVPSGTIFFTGCSFKCVFCQNWDISSDPLNGVVVSPRELAEIAKKLYYEGAKNINYVGGNPDQQLHVIVESLRYMDVNIPLLWNSNMYMTEKVLEVLLDLIDIWLPDFKYGNNECALRYSRVPRYFDVVSRNHSIICKGNNSVIIRHLVLPMHIECCSKPVLKWIADNCSNALVNIMDQYRPEYLVLKYPDKYSQISHRVPKEELDEIYRYADKLKIVWRPIS